MNALQKITDHLTPGKVYRRSDLAKWSNAIDRHLGQLQKEGTLQKISAGTYYYPKQTSFGKSAPSDRDLIYAFLKDSRFLIINPTTYNVLGLGTTQLYNETLVYNHKRHGHFKLGNRYFHFIMKPYFPSELSLEFLAVDIIDHLDRLLEDKTLTIRILKEKISSMNSKKLLEMLKIYGGLKSKKFFDFKKESSIDEH